MENGVEGKEDFPFLVWSNFRKIKKKSAFSLPSHFPKTLTRSSEKWIFQVLRTYCLPAKPPENKASGRRSPSGPAVSQHVLAAHAYIFP